MDTGGTIVSNVNELIYFLISVELIKKNKMPLYTYCVQVEPGLGRTTTVLLSRGTLKPSAYLVGELVSLGQGHSQAFSLLGGGVGKSRTGSFSSVQPISGGGAVLYNKGRPQALTYLRQGRC